MGSDWKEAKERVVKLPEDDSDIFRTYLHWLYCGTFPCREDKFTNVEHFHHAKVYVFGDKMLDTCFCDAGIDAMIDKYNTLTTRNTRLVPDSDIIRYIYDNSIASSPVRQILVDMYVVQAKKEWLHERTASDYPPEFLLHLALGLLDKSSCVDPRLAGPCKYHQHESGSTNCYRKRSETKDGKDDGKDCGKDGGKDDGKDDGKDGKKKRKRKSESVGGLHE